MQADFRRLDVGAHHAGHAALVGQRQRAVVQRTRALNEFLGMRRTAQEGEIADRVQFGIIFRDHCKNLQYPGTGDNQGGEIIRRPRPANALSGRAFYG